MTAVTLTNWVVRRPPWLRLFQGATIAGAVLAVVLSLRATLYDNTVAQGVLVLALALLAVRAFLPGLSRRRVSAVQPESLERIAASHWRITFEGGKHIDGHLRRAWRGWAWTTLWIQPHGQSGKITELTVWRATVSDVAWHQLRMWTVWELSMARPNRLRRRSIEPF